MRKLTNIIQTVSLIIIVGTCSCTINGDADYGNTSLINITGINHQDSKEILTNSGSIGIIPFPGSWVWESRAGITASPRTILWNLFDRDLFVFTRGNDNALWYNYNGSWHSLGGSIASDPYIIGNYPQIHVFARGIDNALMYCEAIVDSNGIQTYNWHNLGGTISSTPSAAFDPVLQHHITIAVRYSDNALWINSLNTLDKSSTWKRLGGYLGGSVTLNPNIIQYNSRNMTTYVRGSDGALWSNLAYWNNMAGSYDYSWSNLGGQITSDPVPLGYHDKVFVRGADNSLWMLDQASTNYRNWVPLGGYILGNPFPIYDYQGFVHVYVRGGDNGLWDNVIDTYSNRVSARWYSLGGNILSDPSASLVYPYTVEGEQLWAVTRGGDGALWINKII